MGIEVAAFCKKQRERKTQMWISYQLWHLDNNINSGQQSAGAIPTCVKEYCEKHPTWKSVWVCRLGITSHCLLKGNHYHWLSDVCPDLRYLPWLQDLIVYCLEKEGLVCLFSLLPFLLFLFLCLVTLLSHCIQVTPFLLVSTYLLVHSGWSDVCDWLRSGVAVCYIS